MDFKSQTSSGCLSSFAGVSHLKSTSKKGGGGRIFLQGPLRIGAAFPDLQVVKGDDGSAMYRVRDRGKERILEPGEAGLGVEGERGDIPNAYGFGKELKHQGLGVGG